MDQGALHAGLPSCQIQRLFPLRTNCFFPLRTLNEEGLQRGGATLSVSLCIVSFTYLQHAFLCHLLAMPRARVSSFPSSLRSRTSVSRESRVTYSTHARTETGSVGYKAGFRHYIHVVAAASSIDS